MNPLTDLRIRVASALRQGMAWWLSELAGLIPQRFARRPESAAAILELSAGQATLRLAGRRGGPPVAMSLPTEDPQQVAAALRQRAVKSVVIRLDPSLTLEAGVTLPLNAERSLRPILVNQLDRLVPLPADAVEFAYVITQRMPKTRTLAVRLVVATRASIDRGVALIRAIGLEPGVAIAQAAPGRVVTLWRPNQAQLASPSWRWLRRGLEATAILLLIAAYGVHVSRLDDYRDQLQQQVAAATKASVAARDLMQQNAQTQDALTLLLNRQREMGPLLLLNELTKLVPDGMWVSQLSVRARNVEIIGYAPRVRDLIERIENHDAFYDPKFRSPITMSSDGRLERFDVSFDIWIEPAP
jgi:general secretion pathway protein L